MVFSVFFSPFNANRQYIHQSPCRKRRNRTYPNPLVCHKSEPKLIFQKLILHHFLRQRTSLSALTDGLNAQNNQKFCFSWLPSIFAFLIAFHASPFTLQLVILFFFICFPFDGDALRICTLWLCICYMSAPSFIYRERGYYFYMSVKSKS